MPVRYNSVVGDRFWNISQVAEVGGKASSADVKFVQFLLGTVDGDIPDRSAADAADLVIPQSGQFDEDTRIATIVLQMSSPNMSVDGRVSPMRGGNISYPSGSGHKYWTLEALQFLYTAHLFGLDKSRPDQVRPNVNEAMDWLPFDEGLDPETRADMFAHYTAV
ncbi:MAG: hypothetical protein ABI178_02430 [Rhodanobacter sp.]